MTTKFNCLVLLSGGIDSFACAHFLLNNNHRVKALFIDFGQGAAVSEWEAAENVATYLEISVQRVKISNDTSFREGEIIGRNLMLTAIGLTFTSSDTSGIALGIHYGTSYFDCSSSFSKRLNTIIQDCSNGSTSLLTPFISWSKQDILEYSNNHHMPLEFTYSCEKQNTNPCGKCLSCLDRMALKC